MRGGLVSFLGRFVFHSTSNVRGVIGRFRSSSKRFGSASGATSASSFASAISRFGLKSGRGSGSREASISFRLVKEVYFKAHPRAVAS